MIDCYMKLIILVSVVIVPVHSDNFTEKYMTMGSSKQFQDRQHRLLTFNTDSEGEIQIEMEFAVPFISIPVKRALDMSKGAVANFNIGSLLLSGAIVFVTAFVLPVALKLIDQKLMPLPVHPGFGRNIEEKSSEIWKILTTLDQGLLENSIDTTSCMQKMMCWIVNDSLHKIAKGQGSSTNKIVDGLVSNEWLNEILAGTAIQSAISHGKHGVNCSNKYSSCKLNEKLIRSLMVQFTNAINYS